MRVVYDNIYNAKSVKHQNSNKAERCFNAYKASNQLCCAYETDIAEASLDTGVVFSEGESDMLWPVLEIAFMLKNDFPKDVKKVFEWYERGAKRGCDGCQLAMFYMYRYGNGVEVNYYKAVFWLKLSAEGENPAAMFVLGRVYLDGFVERADGSKALYWLERSARAGYYDAMLCLGDIAENGSCASPDMEEAYKWYSRASELDRSEAHIRLAQLVFREFQDNEKYVKKAVRGLNKSIKTGNGEAAFVLGTYYKGLGKAYHKKAFSLIKKYADSEDNVLAAFEVAEMYETGCGVAASEEKAMEYYSKVLDLL